MPLNATGSGREGIVHVMGPELGLTQPGMTIVCGDSHTSTHGAFGALAFGIGTSEVEHVLATQTLLQSRPKTMLDPLRRASCRSASPRRTWCSARSGGSASPAASGHAIEYAGPAIEALSMEGRMTVCNMSIEAGARAGMIAPDDTTFAYLEGRPGAPQRRRVGARARRVARAAHRRRRARSTAWSRSTSSTLTPQVTWGTNPGMVAPVDGRVPDPAAFDDPPSARRSSARCDYMALEPGHADRGDRGSTASSSARARTRGSRTCARPPPS